MIHYIENEILKIGVKEQGCELTSIYGYFLAVICVCSVIFIFALTLLAHTSAAVGG